MTFRVSGRLRMPLSKRPLGSSPQDHSVGSHNSKLSSSGATPDRQSILTVIPPIRTIQHACHSPNPLCHNAMLLHAALFVVLLMLALTDSPLLFQLHLVPLVQGNRRLQQPLLAWRLWTLCSGRGSNSLQLESRVRTGSRTLVTRRVSSSNVLRQQLRSMHPRTAPHLRGR